MKKYLLREVKKIGIESANDIFVGCTAGSQNVETRCVFENRDEAISTLRNNEYFQESNVIRNCFTKDCFEVTEFFVVLAEVEDDNPIEDGIIVAYSDMPDETNKVNWRDNPEGF